MTVFSGHLLINKIASSSLLSSKTSLNRLNRLCSNNLRDPNSKKQYKLFPYYLDDNDTPYGFKAGYQQLILVLIVVQHYKELTLSSSNVLFSFGPGTNL
ncbi:hypothetical protein GCM10028791_34220 [Echinicola sediminis]